MKCAQYWPLGVGQGYEDDMIFEDVSLRVTLLGEQDCNNFIKRWMEIEDMAVSLLTYLCGVYKGRETQTCLPTRISTEIGP